MMFLEEPAQFALTGPDPPVALGFQFEPLFVSLKTDPWQKSPSSPQEPLDTLTSLYYIAMVG